MAEEMRHIRCDGYARCGRPAVYEVRGPAPTYLCEECAEERAEENYEERWVHFGEARYLRMLEEAVDTLDRVGWKPSTAGPRNSALEQVLQEALAHLEEELGRARRAHVAVGGKPQPTQRELRWLRERLEILGGEWKR